MSKQQLIDHFRNMRLQPHTSSESLLLIQEEALPKMWKGV